MSFVQMMAGFLGSSGNAMLDFVIYSLFALFILKLILGLFLKLFDI